MEKSISKFIRDKRVTYISRGRNSKSTIIGRWFTNVDYNFDYRGKNTFLMLLKAWITSTEVNKADIYLVEGGLCFFVSFFLKLRFKAPLIILMVVEPMFIKQNGKNLLGKIKTSLKNLMYKKIDGVIAISEMVANDAKYYLNCPIGVAHHFMLNHQRFINNDNQLTSKKILFVIERPVETGYIKGLDIVVESFKILKSEIKEAELYIVGSGTEYLDYNCDGIHYVGYSKNIESIISECSVVISPSRYDAFNLAILEGCASGLIPVISERTGVKEVIEPIDSSLVVKSNEPEAYAYRIKQIFETDLNVLNELSKKLRIAAQYFNQESCHEEYINAWNYIMNDIAKRERI